MTVRGFVPARLLLLYCSCLLIGLLFCTKLAAQSGGKPFFRNYSTDDGLASPEVHDIIQDSLGYLWIATDNGISRFDGYGFKNYGAREGLINNVAFHLQEGPGGKIWIQTMSGNVFYYLQDSIYPYTYNDTIQLYRRVSGIPNGFILSEQDWSYFSLRDMGILKIHTSGEHRLINQRDQLTSILLEYPSTHTSLYSNVTSHNFGKLGLEPPAHMDKRSFWGVYADTLINHQEIHLVNNQHAPRPNGFSDQQFQLLDLRQDLYVFEHYVFKGLIRLPSPATVIKKTALQYWIGLGNKQGVWSFTEIKEVLGGQVNSFLTGHSISAICQDKLGGYWFGSLEEGIFYAPNLQLKVIDHDGLFSRDQVKSLEKWENGKVLLGTDNGVVFALDATGTVTEVYSGNKPIFDLYYHHDRRILWIASSPATIVDLDKIRHPQYGPGFNYTKLVSVKKYSAGRDGRALYCTSSVGFEVIDLEKEEVVFTTFQTTAQERALSVFEDLSGRIWVGNTLGLFEFKEQRLHAPVQDHHLFRVRIEVIDQLADSTLVLGTKGGGVLLWKDSRFEIIDEGRGLTANMIENLIIDSLQQIWVGTLNGLNKLYRPHPDSSWRVRRITMGHGLPSNEINDLLQVGDRMLTATARGLVMLPLQDTTRAGTPAPFLEKILVNGRSGNASQLQTLSYAERNIQLYFVCINHKFGDQILYRYRLSGLSAWSYTKDRSVNYSAMQPGDYIFEVQAQNEDGIWSPSLSVPMSIAAPFWQHWWFVILMVAILFCLTYYFSRRRISRLKKEAAVERDINELHRSALQAQMNPHFIFNCLNAIQNFIAAGDKDNAMQYLSRFARLVRTTLHASTQPAISLEEELQLIENYLELEKLRFGTTFEYAIEVDPQLDHFDTLLPPLLVQPFVENAIIHGFRFPDSSTTGKIHLAYTQEPPYLRITIRDNGIGIYRSRESKADHQALSRSLGMSITEKRLKLQSPSASDQRLQVNELYDAEGRTAGTEIVIRIKL